MKRWSLLLILGICVASVPVAGQQEVAKTGTGNASASDNAVAQRPADSKLEETLVALEKQSWLAWKQRDGKFFEKFLSDDHVEIHSGGVTRKAEVVAGVSSPVCVVESYAVDGFKLTLLEANSAVLTYHASQKTLCSGKPVPSPVWVSSLYIRRAGHWLNAMYQQTQAAAN